MRSLILGIGQALRGDDAAGPEIVRLWQVKHPETAARLHVEVAGLPGLGLLDLLEGMDAAILVDAVQADLPAGTLLRLGLEELAAFAPGSGSAHGWGVAETLKVGLALYPWLQQVEIVLIGIVGSSFEMGTGLSEPVQAALIPAVAMLENEIQGLLRTHED